MTSRSKGKSKQEEQELEASESVSHFAIELDAWEDGELQAIHITELDRWLLHTAHSFDVHVGGVQVSIAQRPDAITASKIGVGACAWDGAFVLSAYAAHRLATLPARGRPRCIELGAGPGVLLYQKVGEACGVPGLVLGKLGYHVDITDKLVALPLIQENIQRNELSVMCKAVALEWGLPDTIKQIDMIGPYDLVIAADCMYVDQDGKSPSLPHFLAACRRLLGARAPLTTRDKGAGREGYDVLPTPPGPFSVPSCILTFEDRGFTLREDFMRAAHDNFSVVRRIQLDNVNIPEALRTEHEEVYELYL